MTLRDKACITSADVLYGISEDGVSKLLLRVEMPSFSKLQRCLHNLPSVAVEDMLSLKIGSNFF